MESNAKFIPLEIQLFAEDKVEEESVKATEEKAKEEQKEVEAPKKEEKLYTRDEVNKMLNAERKKAEAEKNEAEKLAKMDEDQKIKYELAQAKKDLADYKSQVNALTLKGEANSYATSKGLPIEYIDDFNYAKETAESVKEKIDKLVDIRSKDLETYLNNKLKQSSPKAVDNSTAKEDPYITGYKNYLKNR